MKRHLPPRILSIDPGTTNMGVAFLRGGTLEYHDVLVMHTSPQSPAALIREASERVEGLIRTFKPTVLAFERTFYNGHGRNERILGKLCAELAALGKRHRLTVIPIAPMSVKKIITGDGHADKTRVAKAIARLHPELRAYLQGSSKWKARFHSNRFDAVAVGMSVRL